MPTGQAFRLLRGQSGRPSGGIRRRTGLVAERRGGGRRAPNRIGAECREPPRCRGPRPDETSGEAATGPRCFVGFGRPASDTPHGSSAVRQRSGGGAEGAFWRLVRAIRRQLDIRLIRIYLFVATGDSQASDMGPGQGCDQSPQVSVAVEYRGSRACRSIGLVPAGPSSGWRSVDHLVPGRRRDPIHCSHLARQRAYAGPHHQRSEGNPAGAETYEDGKHQKADG